MLNHRRLLALLLAPLTLALLTSACAGPPDQGLGKNTWVLTDLKGQPLVSGSNVTLKFDAKGIQGDAGCNSYGGKYKVSGSSLTFSEVTSTLMACADGQVMRQESAFLGALQRTTGYRLEGGQLVLLNADGDTLVILKPES